MFRQKLTDLKELKKLMGEFKWSMGDTFAVQQDVLYFGSKSDRNTRACLFLRRQEDLFVVLPMTTGRPRQKQRITGKFFCMNGNKGDYHPVNRPESFIWRHAESVRPDDVEARGGVADRIVEQIKEWQKIINNQHSPTLD